MEVFMKRIVSIMFLLALIGVFTMASTEIPAVDTNLPENLETATFGLGCFWGSEAVFGGISGVYRTSVGYAGGTKVNPSYYSLGDHTEVVQIQFDSSVISYEGLLEIFWLSHNPYVNYKVQYMSLILYHSEQQKETAEMFVDSKENETGRKAATEVLRMTEFYRAEDYHLKFYLQRDKEILNDLLRYYEDIFALNDSTVAARLNSLLAGKGDRDLMKNEYEGYGLQDRALEKVRKMLY